MAAIDGQERSRGALVGRKRELAELEGALAQAVAGEGRVFLVSGEPGIGKTRLMAEVGARAPAAGARALWGRCWEGGGAPPYWPWIHVLRELAAAEDAHAITRLLGAEASYLAQLLPELRAEAGGPPPSASEHERFYLFDAVLQLVKSAARRSPLVLFFDDLHAADAPSLLLFEFVAREIAREPVLLLGAFREVEARSRASVAEILGEIGRWATSLPLRGLSEDEVAELVARAAGIEPKRSLVTALHPSTGGNPFFLIEIVRVLVAEGFALDRDKPGERPWPLPDTVRQSILRRTAPLSTHARELLHVAAVIGREFDANLLREVSELPIERVHALLAEAAAAGLASPAPGALGRFAFSHSLVPETLYEELPVVRRAELHERTAHAIERLRAGDVEEHLSVIAHHYFQAAASGVVSAAAEYAVRAGAAAAARFAYEEAVSHYDKALQASGMSSGLHPPRAGEILLALGECQWRAGDAVGSRATFARASEHARRDGDAAALARAAIGFGASLWDQDVTYQSNSQLIALLEEALQRLAADDSVLRVRLLARLAVALHLADAPERRSELSRRAVEMAERIGEAPLRLEALYSQAVSLLGPSPLADRAAATDRMLALASELGDREMTFRAHHLRLGLKLEIGDREGVDREFEASEQLAAELRQPFFRWIIAAARVTRALLDGRLEEADRLGNEALSLGLGAAADLAVAFWGLQRFTDYWAQGRLDEIRPPLRSYVDERPSYVPARASLAFLEADTGRLDEARREFELIAARDLADLHRDESLLPTAWYLAHTCVLLGDARRAAILADVLRPFADRFVIVGIGGAVSLGPVSALLGRLSALLGRVEEARAFFDDAIRRNQSAGNRPFLAVAQLHAAELEAASTMGARSARAAELADQAIELAKSLGMPAIVRRAETLVATLAEERAAVGGEARSSAVGRPRAAVVPLDSRGRRAPRVAEASLAPEGDFWTLRYESTVAHIKDVKGLRYLRELLRNPGREFHVADLLGSFADVDPDAPRATVHDGPVSLGGDAGEMLDARAKGEYRRRLAELRGDLEEAKRYNDLGRKERAEAEIAFLTHELARGLGLGGVDRRAASQAERLRLNVTRAIKSAIDRIAESHAGLGHHLRTTVKTGIFCAYDPGPSPPVRWQLS